MDEKNFCEVVEDIEISTPFEQQMKASRYPFIIWGMGSLSYSVKKYMDMMRIKVSCYWVDGNCTISEKDGIPILSFPEIQRKFEKYNVVFGHSKYELKRELKEKSEKIQEIFCIPNLCYNRYQRIEKSFFTQNASNYYENYCMLEDKKSKECMIAYLRCKMSENVDYIIDVFDREINYFNNPCFVLQEDEVYVDVGAYTGDSLELFLKESGGRYKKIYAYEPEEENYILLKKFVKNNHLMNVVCEQTGTWNKKEKLYFNLDEESSSISVTSSKVQSTEINVDALDSMLGDEDVTLIKINFLSGVRETIEGMKQIMIQRKPRLVITVGFDEFALLSIPILIKEINPEYNLYLRFAAAMPARLLLFAV